MERLEAKNIALDAQFIIKQNFLDGYLVNEFSQHEEAGEINLFLTTITYREVLKHFKIHLSLAKSRNINNQAQKLFVLKHFEKYKSYFELPEIDIETCQSEFKAAFDVWIVAHKVKILESLFLTADQVLDDYFEMRPPFEESKKSEFPDAFSLEILRKHFENRNRKCYLISEDEGLKKYQSEVILTKLNAKEILQLIVKELDETSPISFIERKFREKEESVISDFKPFLINHIKNAILSAYMIQGRLIHGIESLEITVLQNSDLYILSMEDADFSMIMSSLLSVKSEIALLSTAISSERDEDYSIKPKENPTVEIMKPILIDIIVKGEYNVRNDQVVFREFSFSPVEGLTDDLF